MKNLLKQIINLKPDGVTLSIKVIPGCPKCEIVGLYDDNSLKIKLCSPPIEGKANKECIKFLSKILNIPKSSFSIISGEKAKNKVLHIKGDTEELCEKLSSIEF